MRAPADKKRRFKELLKISHSQPSHALLLERDFLADYPKHHGARIRHGVTLVVLARYREARLVFQRLLRECPKERLPNVYAHLGHLHAEKGERQTAVAWYRRSVKGDSRDATWWIFLGGELAKMGRLRDAEAVHRKATRCTDGCVDEAHLNLGYVLRAQERFSEAVVCFREALRIDPQYSEARLALRDAEAAINYARNRRPTKRSSGRRARPSVPNRASLVRRR